MSYPEDVSTERLTIAFDGPALRDGTIDVRILAPALLALGDLVEAANDSLNESRAKVTVRIRATGEGSFEISLEVLMSLAKQISAFFASEAVSGPLNLVAVLGLAYGTVRAGTAGVLQALKWLRGRKPERVIENADGTVRLEIGDDFLVVQRQVVVVIENDRARAALKDFVAPLHKDQIDSVEVRQGKEKVVLATKEDLPALEADFGDQELVVESVSVAALALQTVSFQGDNKWRVSDGDHVFWANVEDESFRRDIDEHKRVFGKDDVIVARVRRRQSHGRSGLKSEYVVEEVLEHRRAMQQLHLLPTSAPKKPDPGDTP